MIGNIQMPKNIQQCYCSFHVFCSIIQKKEKRRDHITSFTLKKKKKKDSYKNKIQWNQWILYAMG